LTIGVAIVQISGSGDQHGKDEDAAKASHNRLVGLIAVLFAAVSCMFVLSRHCTNLFDALDG
jgi:hypothetical protein